MAHKSLSERSHAHLRLIDCTKRSSHARLVLAMAAARARLALARAGLGLVSRSGLLGGTGTLLGHGDC